MVWGMPALLKGKDQAVQYCTSTAKNKAQHQMDPLGFWQLCMLYLWLLLRSIYQNPAIVEGAVQQGQAV